MNRPITYEPRKARPTLRVTRSHVNLKALAAVIGVALVLTLSTCSMAHGGTSEAAQIKALKAENAALKAQAAKYHDWYTGYRWAYLRKDRVWAKRQVQWALGRACAHYGIPKAERAWVIGAGTHIAYGESRYNTKAKGGQHLGLFQFNRSWAGTEAQKLSGKWSCYRFVRVYRDGGKAAVRQHWRATVGGW